MLGWVVVGLGFWQNFLNLLICASQKADFQQLLFDTQKMNELPKSKISAVLLSWLQSDKYIYSYFLFLPHSGSILDSQLCWKSGKFQLARWSHEVDIFPVRNHPPSHPATQPPSHPPPKFERLGSHHLLSWQIPSNGMCVINHLTR